MIYRCYTALRRRASRFVRAWSASELIALGVQRGRRTMRPMTLLRCLLSFQDPIIKRRMHHMRLMQLLLALGLLLPSLAWAVPVRTGTPFMVGIGKSNTGSTTVTVPADAQMIVCTTSGYREAVGYFSGGRITIGGSPMTLVAGGDASTAAWQGTLGYRVS